MSGRCQSSDLAGRISSNGTAARSFAHRTVSIESAAKTHEQEPVDGTYVDDR